MQLFYNPDIKKEQSYFTFDKSESRHIIRVLRKKEGDLIYIANGKGDLIQSKIIDANDKRCQVEVISFTKNKNPFDYYLHIAIAPTKNIQRLEWFLEKATEIGISEITPILCERSERKTVKYDRLEKVLISAMKQSLKYTLPKLNPMISLTKFLAMDLQKNKYIAHCVETDKNTLKNELLQLCTTSKAIEIIIIIGPEGDFSPAEITKRDYIFNVVKKHFRVFGFQPIETPSFENSETLM
ncbi:MAG: 16S rRNA (uracil(1498)-N(3))-methyltransferase [Campylobacteraceae bacterium]|nr:16S rRNA (uracil(1498)-N(3))-methyltransferase [Campylobacteraceae bacterium]